MNGVNIYRATGNTTLIFCLVCIGSLNSQINVIARVGAKITLGRTEIRLWPYDTGLHL